MLACECSIIFAFPVVPLEKNIATGAELNDFTDFKEKLDKIINKQTVWHPTGEFNLRSPIIVP